MSLLGFPVLENAFYSSRFRCCVQCPSEMKQLLKTLYNLSGSETEVLYYLCDNEGRTSDIAEELGKDRTTVQRYLSKLMGTGLLERRSETEGSDGGRYYIYRTTDKQELKQKVKDKMQRWEEDKIQVLEQI